MHSEGRGCPERRRCGLIIAAQACLLRHTRPLLEGRSVCLCGLQILLCTLRPGLPHYRSKSAVCGATLHRPDTAGGSPCRPPSQTCGRAPPQQGGARRMVAVLQHYLRPVQPAGFVLCAQATCPCCRAWYGTDSSTRLAPASWTQRAALATALPAGTGSLTLAAAPLPTLDACLTLLCLHLPNQHLGEVSRSSPCCHRA